MNIKDHEETAEGKEITKKHDLEKIKDGNNNPKKIILMNLDEIPEKHIENKGDNSFIFNGKKFKKDKRLSNYIKKNNILREVYKCEYFRHEEKLRQELKLKSFLNVTIEYILPNQKIKSKYILKQDHSKECELKYIKIDTETENNKEIYNREHFNKECEKDEFI